MTDALRPAADFLSRRSVPDPQAPTVRPRRLRTTPAMRRLAREHVVDPAALILPVFVREDIDTPRPVEAMPGVVQHTLDSLRREAAACAEAGIGAIDLFGVPATRDEAGTAAWAEDGILNRGIAAVRAEVGDEVVVCADTCLDEFTSHGHCGLIRPDGPRAGEVDNDATLATYQAMAVSQAEAGAHMVSPSGMMDGQVAAIRAALDATGHDDVAILAYSAKYASAYFGPFREAVGSTLTGDRRAYQQDPANRREGMREVMLDVAEGADIVMVKPAGPYLDVLADVAAASPVPVAAYQVSGEDAMVEAAAQRGGGHGSDLLGSGDRRELGPAVGRTINHGRCRGRPGPRPGRLLAVGAPPVPRTVPAPSAQRARKDVLPICSSLKSFSSSDWSRCPS